MPTKLPPMGRCYRRSLSVCRTCRYHRFMLMHQYLNSYLTVHWVFTTDRGWIEENRNSNGFIPEAWDRICEDDAITISCANCPFELEHLMSESEQ